MLNPENLDKSNAKDTNMFSFGTPAKQTAAYSHISPNTGKTVRFINSPDELASSPGQEQEQKVNRSVSPKKGVYADYPYKSPNARLIDIKNSTWRTKLQMSTHGRHLGNKMLYTVGPREAYVVDKLFDKEMDYLKLGELSHEGEQVSQKKGQQDYVVDIETGYNNEHANKKSKISNEARMQLYDDMTKEHDIVVSSPKKYPRKAK